MVGLPGSVDGWLRASVEGRGLRGAGGKEGGTGCGREGVAEGALTMHSVCASEECLTTASRKRRSSVSPGGEGGEVGRIQGQAGEGVGFGDEWCSCSPVGASACLMYALPQRRVIIVDANGVTLFFAGIAVPVFRQGQVR